MSTIKLNQVTGYLRSAMKANVPVMLWGPPGIGKSSVVHQVAEEFSMNVVDLRLAQLEPTDLRGVPMPDKSTMRAEWFLPAFWPDRATEDGEREVVVTDAKGKQSIKKVPYKAGECPNGPGVVFLDEIEKAPVSVKNASLQLVLDRKVGSYKLPDDWTIVCAGNREEDGAFSQALGAALSNRMLHFEVGTDLDSWAVWARSNGVLEDIIGFLHFAPHLLNKQDKSNSEHAFPTPRSWEMGSVMMKTASKASEQKALLGSAVGAHAAREFSVWQKVYKNTDPKAIIEKGEIPKELDGDDSSARYAIAMSVAFYLRKRKSNIKGAEENVAKFLKALSPELRVVFLKQQTLPCLDRMMKSEYFKDMNKEMVRIVSG